MKIEKRYYQEDAHNAAIEHCKISKEPRIHHQSVGAGKSLQIAFLAKHVVDTLDAKNASDKVKVINISRQGELAEQNSAEYWMIGGKCSLFSASLNAKSTFYRAIFATSGTLYRSLNTVFKDISAALINIDEAHECDPEDILNCIADFDKGFDIYTNKDEKGETKYSEYAVIIAHFLRINPNTRIIGYSGSPFRGSTDIRGKFWGKEYISDVGTIQLVSEGFLVPPVFGFGDDDHYYNLEEFKPTNNENGSDFSREDKQKMQKKILKEKSKTMLIIEEVIERTKDRNGILITCAGKDHCKQVSEMLPPGTWGIVTDSTGKVERRDILDKARKGEIKYVLQVNCLGQGVNVRLWDCCVLLRKIGSLRYLIQLFGRVLRTLKDEDTDRGFIKRDGLILDYTDTIESMGDIYDHPMLDKATAKRAASFGKGQECPVCSTINSEYAVRCIGDADNEEKRCEHFFASSMCFACDTENAPTARNCRKCNAILIDPAKALKNKAYTDADYKEVLSMNWTKTKQGDSIKIEYRLNSVYTKNGIESQEVAIEYFKPFGDKPHDKQRWKAFLCDSINGHRFRAMALQSRTIAEIIQNKAIFDKPTHITHRINDKGFSIINRRKFLSGREA